MLYGFRKDENEPQSVSCMAVVIFLPDFLDEVIAPLRERYDPDYAIVASHITLVAPFETDRPLTEVAEIVAGEMAQLQPMNIELSSINDYYPALPLICWGVKQHDDLFRLNRRLYSALDLPLPYKQFHPHVAIAREISQHRVMIVKEQIVPYLPDETIEVSAVDLVAPIAGANWVSVRTFALSGDQ